MNSGRRNRVMVACVTFETAMVIDPVRFYETTMVHLIHYIRDPNDRKYDIYSEFYEYVSNEIKNIRDDFYVVEHIEKVTNFTIMLKTILKIIEKEFEKDEKSDIFINISSGSSEYIAAATIAAMMKPGTIPFSIPTNKYKIEEIDEIKSTFFKDGVPVGLTLSTREPRRIPTYRIDMPDRHLIEGLRLLDDSISKGVLPKGSDMIWILKENGLWRRSAKIYEDGEYKQIKSDSVYYQRDFVNKWLKYGWVYRDDYEKRYLLTDDGILALKTFYCD